MAFDLSPAVESDMSDLVQILIEAFQEHTIIALMKQDCAPSDLHQRDLENYRYYFSAHHFTKITEVETGKTVAFCRWLSPASAATPPPTNAKKPEDSCRGLNLELYRKLRGDLTSYRAKHWDNTKDYCIHTVAIHPSYQRKGLASRLLHHVLEQADRDNAKIYVDALADQRPFYSRFGFQDVDQFEIDLAPFGGSGVAAIKCTIRQPKAAEV